MARATAPSPHGLVTREEALAILGVKAATLYTYVSRGLVRRLATPGRRQSLYYREDVERMRARGDARAPHGVLAASAVRYGEPIVRTSITEITPEGPRYRNRSAVELAARGVPFEAVAELLWSGLLPAKLSWRGARPSRAVMSIAGELRSRAHLDIHDAMAMVTLATGISRGAPGMRIADAASHVIDARELIRTLCGCFALFGPSRRFRGATKDDTIARSIAIALGTSPSVDSLHAIDAALTLSADHELNPATFVARIAASAEADLHSCVAAAIDTSSGTRIARGCDRLEAYLRHPAGIATLASRLRRGTADSEIVAWGFAHPLYPGGDPRGACLLEIVRALPAPSPQLRQLLAQVDSAMRDPSLRPRLETALVLLAIALRLPAGMAGGLYTLGRVAGWVAHISEQRLAGYLIRPRAKYDAPHMG